MWNLSKQKALARKSLGVFQIGVAVLICLTANGCRQKERKSTTAKYDLAVMKTSKGDMTFELWSDVAPKTVQNFEKLAREGFYNGTAFHRIIKGFMVQGGDPLTKDPGQEARWGTGGPGYTIPAEFNDRHHVRGVLSMARGQDPNSAGSQFFICLAPAPHLDGQYTDFGKLIKGDDVLTAIGNVPVTTNAQGERSRPEERVEIKSIEIESAGSS